MRLTRIFEARADLWICLVLVSATLAVYSQVRHFDSVNYDDPEFVSRNPHLHQGLSVEGIEWAFTSTDAAYWSPMTRLSHLLEYSLFGLRSGGYHLTNLLLHAFASVLLFVFLLRATNARWPSAFVAFLFALHPLHVESVAWVSERKDVLCAVFWFLALLDWVRYTERPSWRGYLWVLLLFCLGLMSKPMIVTLPFVLLLLDVWPLRRPFSRKLLLEKLPFFALSAGSALITYLTQRGGGAVKSLARFPLGLRIENALIQWIVYIEKMFWPVNLAVTYPYPKHLAVWQAAAAGLALACISALVLRSIKSRPYLAVGWFWYLGTLLPAIGLIQAGVQARADRWMYVPMVGLAIMLAWGAADVVRSRPRALRPIAAMAAAALLALVPVTWSQIRTWRNSETLFRHAIAAASGNQEAYLNLGLAVAANPDRLLEGFDLLQAGVLIDPANDRIQTALGVTLLNMDLPAGLQMARGHFEAALRANPDNAVARSNLAVVLFRTGQPEKAIDEAARAVRIQPDWAEGHYRLGTMLVTMPERSREAIEQFREALRIQPDYPEAHYSLGAALVRRPGASNEALHEFEEAVRIAPGYRPGQVGLGILLAHVPGRLPEGIDHLRKALEIQPDAELQKRLEQLESQLAAQR